MTLNIWHCVEEYRLPIFGDYCTCMDQNQYCVLTNASLTTQSVYITKPFGPLYTIFRYLESQTFFNKLNGSESGQRCVFRNFHKKSRMQMWSVCNRVILTWEKWCIEKKCCKIWGLTALVIFKSFCMTQWSVAGLLYEKTNPQVIPTLLD